MAEFKNTLLAGNYDRPTDVTAGTDAQTYWRFYRESVVAIMDLEKKRDLFLKHYQEEMVRGEYPYPLCGDILKLLKNPDAKMTDEEAKDNKNLIKFLLEFLFTHDFIKKHNPTFAGIAKVGYEGYYYTLHLHICKLEYTLRCPNPRMVPEKMLHGNMVMQSDMQYRADKILKAKAKECVRKFDCVCMPTYDWKKCVDAIVADVEGNVSK